jgi:glutamine---fructose-6-phosphate transaminase (isomerizing)
VSDPRVAQTLMYCEAGEAGAVVARQLAANAASACALGARLRALAPRAVVTCARGSSDHAATYAKYLVETRARVLTASAAPSVSSVYGAMPDLDRCVFLAISQSGKSPDLVASARAAKAAGALVVALVNAESSPLAGEADHVLPLGAGPERCVAATKSYVASLAAIAQLVAYWTEDQQLVSALNAAPEALAAAWRLDWSAALPTLVSASHLFVIGRGLGLGIAQEVALKCKETCALHAEAFSGAEVRHGPQALLSGSFPALVLAQNDATHEGIVSLAADLAARGVTVYGAGLPEGAGHPLPSVPAHPVVEPLLLVESAYRLIVSLAIARGQDPDRPPNLRKVTETV